MGRVRIRLQSLEERIASPTFTYSDLHKPTDMFRSDRRTFVSLVGLAAAGAAIPGSAASEHGWEVAETPTDATLAATVGSREGPYAVGEGGLVLARRATGWEAVLESGPTTQSNELNAAAVTDDGRHVWFCGGSGVVGQYDTLYNELTDYSAPEVEEDDGSTSAKTSTWTAMDAVGEADGERIVLANGSGEVLVGDRTDDGGVDWGRVVEPGAGTTITGVSFYAPNGGFVCDTEGAVYETVDGGDSWERVGVYASDAALQGIAVVGPEDATAVAEAGRIYDYNGIGWDEYRVGEDPILAVDRDGPDGLAAGAGGHTYERADGRWERADRPAESDLLGDDLDATGVFPDVAVGTDGTAVERGSYAALPQSLSLWKDVPADVEYELEVAGPIEVREGDAEVEDGTVRGTIEDDETHRFEFDGRVLDFEVVRGPLPQLDASFNDAETSPLRLSVREWTEADSPVETALHGVAAGNVPIAAGEGGRVLRREGGSWYVVVPDGPAGRENALLDAAATDDGGAAWVAGSSGAVGRYDVADDRIEDYSAPAVEGADGDREEKTSTWEAVAVGGVAGDERVLLVNGSGEALPGRYTGDGVEWGQVVKPGGGSSMGGATFLDGSTVYACDTNAKVYRSDDGGQSWSEIGIDGGSVALYDVAAADTDEVNAAGGDGSIFRYNGAVWTKNDAGGDALYGVDRLLDRGVATGGGGAAFTRTLYGWEADETPTEAGLQDVVATDELLDVAVGEGGTILERGR